MIGNIVNGFRASGIWPINRHIFAEHIFEAADNLLTAETMNSSNESASVLQNFTEPEKKDDLKEKEKAEEKDNKEKEHLISSLAEIYAQPSTSKTKYIQLESTPVDINKTIKVLSPLSKNTMKKRTLYKKLSKLHLAYGLKIN